MKRSFAFQGPSLWNSLPSSISSLNLSVSHFKRQLKCYLLNKRNYNPMIMYIRCSAMLHFIILFVSFPDSSCVYSYLSLLLLFFVGPEVDQPSAEFSLPNKV